MTLAKPWHQRRLSPSVRAAIDCQSRITARSLLRKCQHYPARLGLRRSLQPQIAPERKATTMTIFPNRHETFEEMYALLCREIDALVRAGWVSADLAEDLKQEVFLRLWRARGI